MGGNNVMKYFFKRYALIFIIDRETSLKVSADPLPKTYVYVKDEPDRENLRINIL